jgi:hypothetical protein
VLTSYRNLKEVAMHIRLSAFISVALVLFTYTVAAQPGNQPPQNVNVVNSPTVNTTAATVKIYDEVLAARAPSVGIDVSGFKDIRLVVKCVSGDCLNSTVEYPVFVLLWFGDGQPPTNFISFDDRVFLGEPLQAKGLSAYTETYEPVAETIQLLVGPVQNLGVALTTRVIVYGRPN